jgi:hypothetical protein
MDVFDALDPLRRVDRRAGGEAAWVTAREGGERGALTGITYTTLPSLDFMRIKVFSLRRWDSWAGKERKTLENPQQQTQCT